MIKLKSQLTDIPGKVLLSKPCSNTSRRKSKTRAMRAETDVSPRAMLCTGSQGSCTTVQLKGFCLHFCNPFISPTPKPLILLTVQL